jgi:hypothetical protein
VHYIKLHTGLLYLLRHVEPSGLRIQAYASFASASPHGRVERRRAGRGRGVGARSVRKAEERCWRSLTAVRRGILGSRGRHVANGRLEENEVRGREQGAATSTLQG